MISRFNDFAPPTLLAQASRINFSTRLFNLIVTNVPGPQIPLYVLGRELQDVFPVAFLPENHALAIAIMSYNGGINFGLLADYDSMEDVDLIADGLSQSLDELLEAAERSRREPRPTSRRPPTCPGSALPSISHEFSRSFASGLPGRPRGSPPCRPRPSRSGSGGRALARNTSDFFASSRAGW